MSGACVLLRVEQVSEDFSVTLQEHLSHGTDEQQRKMIRVWSTPSSGGFVVSASKWFFAQSELCEKIKLFLEKEKIKGKIKTVY